MNDRATEIKQSSWQIAFITVLLFWLIAAFIQYFNINDWAGLDVNKTRAGELWRLISGHIIHADWQHYLMNMVGLSLCVATFYKDIATKHWPLSFLFIACFSSIGLLMIYPEDYRYVGFSDVLHGWILLGALAICHKETKLSIAIFVLFWLKIIEENMSLTFFTSYGVTGNVAKESHILGAVGGIIYGIMLQALIRRK
jgi:rhomboid family GlyGly-CTERM serine protease